MPVDPAIAGPDPVRSAAAHAALRRGDRRGEVRRACDGRGSRRPATSRATLSCSSRRRSIRWSCTAGVRRSPRCCRSSASSRNSPPACASPTRRPSRSSKWSWPARSTSRSSVTSTPRAARPSGCAAKTATWCRRRRSTAPSSIPNSNIERVVDLGFVGEPDKVDLTILNQILGREMIPVLAPVATSAEGGTFNVNADTFAGAIAGALKAKRLLLLTDVPGVLDKSKKLIHGAIRGGRAQADRRRHDLRRNDPQGRNLHLRAGKGRRGRRHHGRQGAACGAFGIADRPRSSGL